MTTYNTIKADAEKGFAEASIEVKYSGDDAEAGLTALNEAYAEARKLLESGVPVNAVAEVPQPIRSAPLLIDGDGDRWIRQGDGDLYTCEGASLAPRTREQIAAEFRGAQEVV